MNICSVGFLPYFDELFWVTLSLIFMSGYFWMWHRGQESSKRSVAVHDSDFPGCKGLHKDRG